MAHRSRNVVRHAVMPALVLSLFAWLAPSCGDDDPRYLDEQRTVSPEIWIDQTQIQQGDELFVHGCAGYSETNNRSEWRLELSYRQEGTDIHVEGVLHYTLDTEAEADDGEGAEQATLVIPGLATGTYVVRTRERSDHWCAPWFSEPPYEDSYTVTVAP